MQRRNQVLPRPGSIVNIEMEPNPGLTAVPFSNADLSESTDIRWFRHFLKEKVCNRFIPNESSSDSKYLVCVCGYRRLEHSQMALRHGNRDPTSPWTSDKDTILKPTSAFGEMEFVGFGQKISKYAKVADCTPMKNLLDLLMEKWNLEKPNLLISVTGGARNFVMKPRLKQLFNQGLMKAAKSTNAWIITGGMHAGVMRHVGEAVRTSEMSDGSREKAVVIGVAPWGCVANRPALTDPQGKWPAHYIIDSAAASYESPLDMNHSHYILVDNGTQYKFTTEIKLRAELEAAIGNLKGNVDAVSVPRVCVLLEGGPGSLETVKSAIENGTPTVVVDGSGRSADVIAYAYQNAVEDSEIIKIGGHVRKRTKLILTPKTREDVRQMLVDIFGHSSNMDQWVRWVEKCIENENMLTIFSLDNKSGGDNDIDLSLLTALLKTKSSIEDQLRLALSWNRIDIAKDQIFSRDKQWKQREFFDLMMVALKLGHVDFVSLFLENGINMKQFVTLGRLKELYNCLPRNCHLNQFLKKFRKFSNPNELSHVGNLIRELMGEKYLPVYWTDEFKTLEKGDNTGKASNSNIDNARDIEWDESMAYFTDPSRELFIWAVLRNMKSMATLLWVDAKDPIAGALTACTLLKGMASRIREPDVKKDYLSTAEEFEGLAVAVLNECYLANNEQAEHLLIREQPNYGHTTCLELAVNGGNQDFVAHPCVQNLLNRVWNGKISQETPWFQIVMCILCPALIFAILYFHEDEAHNIRKRRKRTESENKDMIQSDPPVNSSEKMTIVDVSEDKSNVLDFYDLGRPLSVLEKIHYFYVSPVVVFTLNCASYVTFLVLMSLMLVTGLERDGVHDIETVLLVWLGTLFCEEIRQMFFGNEGLLNGIKLYFRSLLNMIDIITIFIYVVAFVLRFFDQTFEGTRYLLCLCLCLFYCRLLHIFSISKQLGPILLMIKRMLRDLFWFLLIMAVFMLAYAVIRQSILYPHSPLTGMLLYTVMRSAYWQTQGEIEHFLGETENFNGTCKLTNGVLASCSNPQLIIPPIMAIYILFTNVLMFNLLIAMFNYTYTVVQENTDRVYSFQRYSLIIEYYERPPLPPPLIVLFHIWLICRWVLGCCVKKFRQPWKQDIRLIYQTQAEKIQEKQLVLWENMNADEYARKRNLVELETSEYKIEETREKVEKIYTRFEEYNDQLLTKPGNKRKNDSLVVETKNEALEKRVEVMEDKLDRTIESLDWIANFLSSHVRRSRSRRRIERHDGTKEKEKGKEKEKERRSAKRTVSASERSRWPDLNVKGEDSSDLDETAA